MCKEASFVLTKTKVYWSETSDSHEVIIKEFGLKESGARGPNILRVEIVPPDGDYSKPPAGWIYRVDQDQVPKWADTAEARVRKELPKWIAAKIVLPGQRIESLSGNKFIIYGQVGELRGSSQVGSLWGSSQVGAMWESSQVGAMWDSSRVGAMRDFSQVGAMRESSQVGEMRGYSQVGSLRGSSQVGSLWGSSQVGAMWESSRVGELRGSSQINTFIPVDPAIRKSANSVIIFHDNDVIRVYVGGKEYKA